MFPQLLVPLLLRQTSIAKRPLIRIPEPIIDTGPPSRHRPWETSALLPAMRRVARTTGICDEPPRNAPATPIVQPMPLGQTSRRPQIAISVNHDESARHSISSARHAYVNHSDRPCAAAAGARCHETPERIIAGRMAFHKQDPNLGGAVTPRFAAVAALSPRFKPRALKRPMCRLPIPKFPKLPLRNDVNSESGHAVDRQSCRVDALHLVARSFHVTRCVTRDTAGSGRRGRSQSGSRLHTVSVLLPASIFRICTITHR